MNKKKMNILKDTKGATFIELLLYVAIFLVLTPILLTVAVNSLRISRQYDVEKILYSDSQFVTQRMTDIIAAAKKIDADQSVFNDTEGKLTIITQDDQEVVIELDPVTHRIQITEGGVASNLTYSENDVESLFFEKIPDNIHDPQITVGVNIRMKMRGPEEEGIDQDYVFSVDLKRGDYDNDGCPDYVDFFPRHDQCCGDADLDGICDELDNCILEFNPFQQDYDEDGIGDHCDASAYVGAGAGAGSGVLGAYNCSPTDSLVQLVQHCPPFPSSTLKQILINSSPLAPEVLMAIMKEDNETDDVDDVDCTSPDPDDIMTHGHIQQIFNNNVKWTQEVRDEFVNNYNVLPQGMKDELIAADDAATEVAWTGDTDTVISTYQIEHNSDDNSDPPDWYNRVRFYNPDYPLCENAEHDKSDIFVVEVSGGGPNVDVTVTTASGSETVTVKTNDNYQVTSSGFGIELNERVGNLYAFVVTANSCTEQLDSIEFTFNNNADVTGPAQGTSTYETYRYTAYCEGGCDSNCGDVGSGIIDTKPLNDQCYLADLSYPEWCSRWYTLLNDDTDYPAFVGGTQEGEETAYWEKEFKSILTATQLASLDSITVTGEVAFQNITQFFCDTIPASCPMDATLIEHSIELYNYVTDTWVNIGSTGLDGTTSDQQQFEVLYNGADMLDFFGPETQFTIKARMKFTWDGDPLEIFTEPPAFMLIDYFTIHLKW